LLPFYRQMGEEKNPAQSPLSDGDGMLDGTDSGPPLRTAASQLRNIPSRTACSCPTGRQSFTSAAWPLRYCTGKHTGSTPVTRRHDLPQCSDSRTWNLSRQRETAPNGSQDSTGSCIVSNQPYGISRYSTGTRQVVHVTCHTLDPIGS
jgi:hypothetical protein